MSAESETGTGTNKQRWIPLESNPTVLNKYVHGLGVDKEWNFVDVFGLDPDLLAMVPRPAAAMVLLFPESTSEAVKANPIGEVVKDVPGDLYYTKQTIGNACGTVAIVHALANNQDKIPFDENKHFCTFVKNTKSLSPDDKAKNLEEDMKMGAAHEDCAQEGDTTAPAASDKVTCHFIAFVNFNGTLFELDGRKEGPVSHGATTADSFLEDAAVVVKKFIDRTPGDLNFNVMALVKGGDDM